MEEYISDNSVYARAKSNSMINPKMIGRVLGVLLFIELGMFLLCAGISLGYGEDDYKYFLYTCVINAVAGGLLLLYGRGAENRMSRRDGYCVVTLLRFSGCCLSILVEALIPLPMLSSKRCPDSPPQELQYSMISNLFRMECFSGVASRNGSAGWGLSFLRLPFFLSLLRAEYSFFLLRLPE